MSEGGAAHAHAPAHSDRTPISVGWVLLASLLIGAGLTLILIWLIYFDWIYFSGVFVLLAGALVMLSPKTGLDHARARPR